MSDVQELARRLSEVVDLYTEDLHKSGFNPANGELPRLGSKGLAARDEILVTAEKLLQQARGPAPAVINLLESVISIHTHHYIYLTDAVLNAIGSQHRHNPKPDSAGSPRPCPVNRLHHVWRAHKKAEHAHKPRLAPAHDPLCSIRRVLGRR